MQVTLKGLFYALRRPIKQSCNSVARVASASNPFFNLSKLDDDSFIADLKTNLTMRQHEFDLGTMISLWKRYSSGEHDVKFRLLSMVEQLPNSTHPLTPVGDPSQTRKLYVHGKTRQATFKLKDAISLCAAEPNSIIQQKPFHLNPRRQLRLRNVATGAGTRAYYFGGPLAYLETALIEYTVNRLVDSGFALVSVPDVLPEALIQACGFQTRGKRSQVYHLCSDASVAHCLSGTAEMGLAGFCAGRRFNPKDPDSESSSTAVGLCAVSRCFRQEAPHHEDHLYRVHQFTKVEMFALTASDPAAADAMFDRILRLQIALFGDLGLHFRVLEMPTSELGAPAHRKVDIEAWMPGQGSYGEISSTSNCLDYQAKRLNIRWANDESFAYTLNGTACAIPRMMKAILETHQTEDGYILIPDILRPLMEKQYALQSQVEMRFKYIVSDS